MRPGHSRSARGQNLDAISIASTNHWHSLLAIWARQAGRTSTSRSRAATMCSKGAAGRSRTEVQSDRPARHAEPGDKRPGRDCRARSPAASMASCCGQGYCCKPRWSIGFKDRPRRPRTQLHNLGSARRRKCPITRILSITTGTGSGRPATATWATRASTRWTLPAGASPAHAAKSVVSLGCRYVDGPDFRTRVKRPTSAERLRLRRHALGLRDGGLVARKDKDGKTPFPFKVDVEFYLERATSSATSSIPRERIRRKSWPTSRLNRPTGDVFKTSSSACSRQRENQMAGILGHYSRQLPPGQHFLSPRPAGPFSQQPAGFLDPAGRQSLAMIKTNLKARWGWTWASTPISSARSDLRRCQEQFVSPGGQQASDPRLSQTVRRARAGLTSRVRRRDNLKYSSAPALAGDLNWVVRRQSGPRLRPRRYTHVPQCHERGRKQPS